MSPIHSFHSRVQASCFIIDSLYEFFSRGRRLKDNLYTWGGGGGGGGGREEGRRGEEGRHFFQNCFSSILKKGLL